MKIYIEDEMLEFDNKKDEIDYVLNKIDDIVKKSSKVLSHMLIDGIEIYGEYYDYFLENINAIDEVKIFAFSYRELIEDILVSTLDYVSSTPKQIEGLSNNFYKSPQRETWNELNNLLGGISWIMKTFNSIDKDKRLKDVVSDYKDWNLYAKEVLGLEKILSDFEEALSDEDNITIADILSYEIVPIFNNMKEGLLKLLNVEVL